jgi:hypothetical protein
LGEEVEGKGDVQWSKEVLTQEKAIEGVQEDYVGRVEVVKGVAEVEKQRRL